MLVSMAVGVCLHVVVWMIVWVARGVWLYVMVSIVVHMARCVTVGESPRLRSRPATLAPFAVGLLLWLPHPWLQTGSGYHIYDNGLNPKHCVSGASVRRDLGFIGFDYDAMGPGKLVVRQQRAVAGVVWCGVVWCGVVWSGTRVGVWFVAM